MTQFNELSISAPLASNLTRLGYQTPTPVQAQAIEPALAGKDIVATAQTGTGKTLAFLLPLIERLAHKKGINALILSPTRELAIQIDDAFQKLSPGSGLRSAVIVGGMSERAQLTSVRKGAQVLIATPGRLYDFLSRGLVQLGGVKVLVLDEADRMLDMGFLPTIERILAATPADRQTGFFSATMDPNVKHLVQRHVRDAVRIEVGATTKTADQVDLFVYEVDQAGKLDLLTSMLREEEGSFLVFARTKHGADRLAKRVSEAGFKTAAIHGDRSQGQRNQALKGFQDGYYRVLVATDVAARGIHVDGIAHVVNFDLPQAAEDFIHRVGRTGRAGARGVATTFALRMERGDVGKIERLIQMKLTRKHVPGAPAEIIEIPKPKWRSFGPSKSRRRRAV
jgi:ATP-dependent RNA helicase RhlE